MALRVHRGDHPTLLVGVLCDLLAQRLVDPFAPEVIAVPTRGIERWLTQEIASVLASRGVGDGVAANIEFPFPHRLVTDTLAGMPEAAPSIEAWRTSNVVRHVEDVVDARRDDPWMLLLSRFIEGPDGVTGSTDDAQRLRAAQKIARLFSAYARRRPGMITAWASGRDLGPDGGPLVDSAAWQPRLWRLVREQIGTPSLPEMLPAVLAGIRAGTGSLDSPERMSIYGITAIDPMDLDVFEAIGEVRDVHLFVLHPSPVLWQDVADRLADGAVLERLPRRAGDATRSPADHLLLRSWGQESRELHITLAQRRIETDAIADAAHRRSTTMLTSIQADIRANRLRPFDHDDPRTIAIKKCADQSIQVYVCHGTQRQVEVLRDAVLHLLADDPTLEPRDVVIMTPDLETYAPLIEAAFPRMTTGLPDLRVRIADRAPARTNPLVRFAGTVLELAASRIETEHVRELINLPLLQRRFGIDVDTARSIEALVDDANIRWGLDADHRERCGVGDRDEHTWRRGLDRVVLGVLFADDATRTTGGLAPLTGIEGQAAVAAGRLAHLIDRVAAATALLREPRPASQWASAIDTAVRLLAAPDWDDEWQWSQLRRLLNETFTPDGEQAADPMLGLAEATLLISPWTADTPSPLHHRTGDITVCSLVPMRSVPYRVVCLLGMDHDRFPRSSRYDGDDLLVDDEVVGDTDRGAADRQLLLDALMAAGDHLLITYAGRDELTNAVYPPSVPIAELIDLMEDMVGKSVVEHLVTHHPLQPFSADNFTPGKLRKAGPWGFDTMQYNGAKALRDRSARHTRKAGFLSLDEAVDSLGLEELIRFLVHPSRAYLRHRFGFTIPRLGERHDDALPTGLGGLERWGVSDRVLSGLAAGGAIDELVAYERGSDSVPAGNLASGDLDSAVEQARRLWQAASERGYDPSRHLQFMGSVDLGAVSVNGAVAADPDAFLIASVTPSKMKGKHSLEAYARHVFLTALHPDRPWRSMVLSRNTDGKRLCVIAMRALGDTPSAREEDARGRLQALVDLYVEGMSRPVPIFCETSHAWHAADEERRYRDARGKWEPSPYGYGQEGEDPSIQMLFPDLLTMSDLVACDFPVYAAKLWDPIRDVSKRRTTS